LAPRFVAFFLLKISLRDNPPPICRTMPTPTLDTLGNVYVGSRVVPVGSMQHKTIAKADPRFRYSAAIDSWYNPAAKRFVLVRTNKAKFLQAIDDGVVELPPGHYFNVDSGRVIQQKRADKLKKGGAVKYKGIIESKHGCNTRHGYSEPFLDNIQTSKKTEVLMEIWIPGTVLLGQLGPTGMRKKLKFSAIPSKRTAFFVIF